MTANPNISTQTIAMLRDGTFIDRSEPVVLLGNSGAGKSHLLIAACLAAVEGGRRVRYTTCAQLADEFCKAKDDNHLSRVITRYGKLDLLAIDELGYVHLDQQSAELLFQILTEREERASIAGRTGVCWDNAFAESFWASLKRECVKGRIFETRAAARQAIFVWINWCNTTRLHSSLDYKTPKTWEQEFPIAS